MSSQTESPHWVYASKSSFAAGELTPTIEGRADLPLYQNGAKKIINWMILPSGGLTRRPGTEFIWAKTLAPENSMPKPANMDVSSASSTDESGSEVSISSDPEDDLPPIGQEGRLADEELTFVPTAQDPTSRLYRIKAKRDEGARFFDYGILDEEDAVYRESTIDRGFAAGEKLKEKRKEEKA